MKTVSLFMIAVVFTVSVVPWAIGAEPKKPAPKEKPKAPNAKQPDFRSTYISKFEKYWQITLSPKQKTGFGEVLGTFEEYLKIQVAQTDYVLKKDPEMQAIYERRNKATSAGDEKGIMQALVDHRKLLDAGPEGVMMGKLRAILTAAQQKVMDDKITDDDQKMLATLMKSSSDSKKKAK